MPGVYAQNTVMISEVEANPPGTDAGNEWLTLYNPASSEVDIGGWTIQTTHGRTNSFVIPSGTMIGACGEHTIRFPNQFLDNENESVILFDSRGNKINQTPLLTDTKNDQQTWKTLKPNCTVEQKTSVTSKPETSPKSVPKESIPDQDYDKKQEVVIKNDSSAREQIPSWVKANAEWWSENRITDQDFTRGLEYLVQQRIIKIPHTTPTNSNQSEQIPSWLRNNASWWSRGLLSDDEFVNGIQYLISNGVIKIPPQQFQCLGNALCITAKVERIVDGDTIYIEGYRVRLSLTNTPERGQTGFMEASGFTENFCPVGSTVRVDQDDGQPYDAYGRLVGKVYCGEKSLNSELLYNGHANILTQYCSKSEFSAEDWAKRYGC